MTRVADTSALYALFDEDDEFHRRARTDFEHDEPTVAPTEILVETLGLISLRFGRKTARQALADLLNLRNVVPAEKVNFDGVRRVFEDANGRLSLADAYVVQTCKALGAKALSYDKEIHRALR